MTKTIQAIITNTFHVLCNVCHKKVGKINIEEIHPSVLVSVVCNDCQALASCNKGE